MTLLQISEYIRDNLKINIRQEKDYESESIIYVVELKLEDRIISQDYIYIRK